MAGPATVTDLEAPAKDTTSEGPEVTKESQGSSADLAPPTGPALTQDLGAPKPPPPPQLNRSLRENIGASLGLAIESLEPDTYATFRSLRGSDHQITHQGAENLMVKQPDGSMKSIPNPGSGKHSEFENRYLVTADPVEIRLLVQNEAFDVEYTIDEDDPTGYWAKLGVIELEPVTVMARKSQKRGKEAAALVTGGLTVGNTER